MFHGGAFIPLFGDAVNGFRSFYNEDVVDCFVRSSEGSLLKRFERQMKSFSVLGEGAYDLFLDMFVHDRERLNVFLEGWRKNIESSSAGGDGMLLVVRSMGEILNAHFNYNHDRSAKFFGLRPEFAELGNSLVHAHLYDVGLSDDGFRDVIRFSSLFVPQRVSLVPSQVDINSLVRTVPLPSKIGLRRLVSLAGSQRELDRVVVWFMLSGFSRQVLSSDVLFDLARSDSDVLDVARLVISSSGAVDVLTASDLVSRFGFDVAATLIDSVVG